MQRRDAGSWVAIALAAGAAAWLALARDAFVSDDAYISFRYAHNLVEGRGLVWNPGLDPVEGYSNLLWVLVAALGLALGQPAAAWSQAVGTLLAAGSVVATAGCVRAVGAGRLAAVGAALLAATSLTLGFWARSGLETPLLTFLLTAGTWAALAEDRRVRAGGAGPPLAWLLFGLAGITRAEGPLYLAIPALLRLLRLGVEPLGRRDLVRLLLLVGPAAGQLALRLSVYGALLPQTFAIKVLADVGPWPARALRYLLAGLTWNPTLGLLAVGGGAAALRAGRGALLLPAAACVVLVLVADGDEFGQLRLLAPTVPTLLAAGTAGLDALYRDGLGRRLAVLTLGLYLGVQGARWSLGTEQVRAAEARGAPGGVLPAGPWVERQGRSWGRALNRPDGVPPPEPAWFELLLVETVPVGGRFLFHDVGRVGYALTDAALLDGRGLNWVAAADLVRASPLAGGLQHPAAERFLAELAELRPELLALQCRGGALYGPLEAVLLADGSLQRDYRFLASGEYIDGAGELCLYRRIDAAEPPRAQVLARYERLQAQLPELDWATRARRLRAGAPLPASDPKLAPLLPTPGRYDPDMLRGFPVAPGPTRRPDR